MLAEMSLKDQIEMTILINIIIIGIITAYYTRRKKKKTTIKKDLEHSKLEHTIHLEREDKNSNYINQLKKEPSKIINVLNKFKKSKELEEPEHNDSSKHGAIECKARIIERLLMFRDHAAHYNQKDIIDNIEKSIKAFLKSLLDKEIDANTTKEILKDIKNNGIGKESVSKIKNILTNLEKIKYDNYERTTDEFKKLLEEIGKDIQKIRI